jgi:hypothetical protein
MVRRARLRRRLMTGTRFAQVTQAIGQAQLLSRAASELAVPAAPDNTPWMPFNLFDFSALLFEAIPMIPDAGRFLVVGAGPGPEMLIARDVYGLDVYGIEILDELAAMGRAAGLDVATADADDWAGYEKYDCVWLNRPVRDAGTETFLEDRIWREMSPGSVIICANTQTRPPQSWIIVTDMWDDLRRGSWIKPYPEAGSGK